MKFTNKKEIKWKKFVDVNSFEKWKALAETQDFRCIYCGFDFLASPGVFKWLKKT